jgi:hypothetical protein
MLTGPTQDAKEGEFPDGTTRLFVICAFPVWKREKWFVSAAILIAPPKSVFSDLCWDTCLRHLVFSGREF